MFWNCSGLKTLLSKNNKHYTILIFETSSIFLKIYSYNNQKSSYSVYEEFIPIITLSFSIYKLWPK